MIYNILYSVYVHVCVHQNIKIISLMQPDESWLGLAAPGMNVLIFYYNNKLLLVSQHFYFPYLTVNMADQRWEHLDIYKTC